MWILYAIGSSFFAGITSILAKCGIHKTDSDVATALRTIIVLFFSWFMVYVTGVFYQIDSISMKTYLFLILSGLATGASWLCYFKALQRGNVNQVVPIDKSSTILTIILALIFLHEGINIYKLISIVCIAIGTLMMISKKEDTSSSKGNSWLIYACLSALFASLTAILGKIGMNDIDSNLGTAIRTFVVLVMAWFMVIIQHKQKEVFNIDQKELIYIILSGFATGASWLCYYHALQLGPASVVVPIDKLSIVVTIIFSRVVFNERLNKKSLFGLLSIIVGTMILTIV